MGQWGNLTSWPRPGDGDPMYICDGHKQYKETKKQSRLLRDGGILTWPNIARAARAAVLASPSRSHAGPQGRPRSHKHSSRQLDLLRQDEGKYLWFCFSFVLFLLGFRSSRTSGSLIGRHSLVRDTRIWVYRYQDLPISRMQNDDNKKPKIKLPLNFPFPP
jgi:hypothetical protein